MKCDNCPAEWEDRSYDDWDGGCLINSDGQCGDLFDEGCTNGCKRPLWFIRLILFTYDTKMRFRRWIHSFKICKCKKCGARISATEGKLCDNCWWEEQ